MASEAKLKQMLLKSVRDINAAREAENQACEYRMKLVDRLIRHYDWTWVDIHAFERENHLD